MVKGASWVAPTLDAEPEVAPAKQYLATKSFTISSPITKTFQQGEVLEAGTLVSTLLAGKAPIVEIDSAHDLTTCPYCRRAFFSSGA